MNFKLFIKLTISTVMLLVVFYYVDLATLKQTLLSIPLPVVINVILLYMLGQMVSAYKWWLIASTTIQSPFKAALKAYFIGMYVNCFGLGTVGGDVARGLILAGGRGVKTESLASVISDRAHGLLVLALIGILSFYALEQDLIAFSYKLILAFSALAIIVGWFTGPAFLIAITPKTNRFRNKVERIAAQFPRDPARITYITFVAVVFHVIQIVTNGYIIAAMGIDISWLKVFAAIPFVNILGTLPISWQGLGVRESSLVFFFSGLLTSEQAITMGALWFSAVVISSAFGGIVAALTGDLNIIANRSQSEPS